MCVLGGIWIRRKNKLVKCVVVQVCGSVSYLSNKSSFPYFESKTNKLRVFLNLRGMLMTRCFSFLESFSILANIILLIVVVAAAV